MPVIFRSLILVVCLWRCKLSESSNGRVNWSQFEQPSTSRSIKFDGHISKGLYNFKARARRSKRQVLFSAIRKLYGSEILTTKKESQNLLELSGAEKNQVHSFPVLELRLCALTAGVRVKAIQQHADVDSLYDVVPDCIEFKFVALLPGYFSYDCCIAAVDPSKRPRGCFFRNIIMKDNTTGGMAYYRTAVYKQQ